MQTPSRLTLDDLNMRIPSRDAGPCIAVDFDGVLHSYTSGWKGATRIPDPPTTGAIEWLNAALARHVNVCVYSSRSHQPGGVLAMARWLQDHGVPFGEWWVRQRLFFPSEKPPAIVHLDDRAWRFNGTWPPLEDLLAFRPWWRDGATPPPELVTRQAEVTRDLLATRIEYATRLAFKHGHDDRPNARAWVLNVMLEALLGAGPLEGLIGAWEEKTGKVWDRGLEP